MKIYLIALLITLTACLQRPVRPKSSENGSGLDNMGRPIQNPVAQVGPIYTPPAIDLNIANDTYISIGSNLKKELDSSAASKPVKVFVQIRQENNIAMNLDALKATLGTANTSVGEAVDNAKKSGFSTLEFTIDLASLKSSLEKLKNGVSSIEVSLSPTN